MRGHVAMQVPCDSKNNTSLQIFIGQAPNLTKIDPQLVKQLSTPGKQCFYHVDIASHQNPDNPLITDVIIKNSGTNEVKLTDVSTIIVGVNEVMANPAGAHPGAMGGM
jgi:hypothetical protein